MECPGVDVRGGRQSCGACHRSCGQDVEARPLGVNVGMSASWLGSGMPPCSAVCRPAVGQNSVLAGSQHAQYGAGSRYAQYRAGLRPQCTSMGYEGMWRQGAGSVWVRTCKAVTCGLCFARQAVSMRSCVHIKALCHFIRANFFFLSSIPFACNSALT